MISLSIFSVAGEIEGCLAYKNSDLTICSRCDTQRSYRLTDDRCRKTNESFWNGVNGCGILSDCSKNEFFSLSGRCLQIMFVPFCVNYSNNRLFSFCTECQPGYKLRNNSCVIKIKHCKSYGKKGNCSVCRDGYILNSNKCKKRIPKCLKFLDFYRCMQCKTGFGLSCKKDMCLNTIDNCDQYSASGDCTRCIDNYSVSLDKKSCKSNIAHCIQFSATTNPNDLLCLTCCDGFKPSDDNKQCQAADPNCLKWKSNDNTICEKCKGNTVWNSALKACINQISFCDEYTVSSVNSFDFVCSSCIDGYILNNFNRCSLATTCKKNQTFCLKTQSCVVTPACCLTVDNCGNCLSFKPGTDWCDQTNSCYNLNKQCPNSYNCETKKCLCSGKSIWISATSTCISIPQCCEEYDLNGICLSYKLGRNWCPETNRCYNIPKNCPANHNCKTGLCTCPNGYEFNKNSGQCMKKAWCCEELDLLGNCARYSAGTNWSNTLSRCFRIPARCLNDYNQDTGKCNCPVNYSWCPNSSSCVKIPKCCLTNDHCGKCLTFKTGTGWCQENNKCFNIPKNGLENYNCVTGEYECPPDQIFNIASRKCIALLDCCDIYNKAGKCAFYKQNKGWCKETNSCYDIPSECPFVNNHNCSNGACICPNKKTWCSQLKQCVSMPSCCLKADSCGNCLQFKDKKGFCNQTKKCYNIPTACPTNHDCESLTCTCPPGKIWNSSKKSCIDMPNCCLVQNEDGVCTKFKDGTGYCDATKSCYVNSKICPLNYDCATGECVCPLGSSWCLDQLKCVQLPLLCDLSDSCGNCLSVTTGYTICPTTLEIVPIPAACPDKNDLCGNCICDPLCETWCTKEQKCAIKPAYCKSNDECGTCLQCEVNYYLVDGDCLPPVEIPHCEIYSSDRQTCTQCHIFFSHAKDGLSCIADNCEEFSLVDYECDICKDGHVLVDGLKICLAILNECNGYIMDLNTMNPNCSQCNYPYSLDQINKICYIPRCLEYESNTSTLTCKTCINQNLKSEDSTICYPAIEKCVNYSIDKLYYSCTKCEFGYEISILGFLCVPAVYNILSFNDITATANIDGYGVLSSIQGFVFTFGTFGATSEQALWYLTSYNFGEFFTIRLQIPVDGIMTPFYLTANGNSIQIYDYFLIDDRFKWVLESANIANMNNVRYIKSLSNGLYLDYAANLSLTKEKFFFK